MENVDQTVRIRNQQVFSVYISFAMHLTETKIPEVYRTRWRSSNLKVPGSMSAFCEAGDGLSTLEGSRAIPFKNNFCQI
jgi:hypothetical protein